MKFVFLTTLIIFTVIALFVIIIFIFSWRQNKLINKSVFKSFFHQSFSIVLLIVFYFLTFGLIGSMSAYTDRLEKSINKMAIDHQVYHGNIGMEFEGEYNIYLASFVNSNMNHEIIADNGRIENHAPISKITFLSLVNFGTLTRTDDDTYFNDILWVPVPGNSIEYNGTTYYNAYNFFQGDFGTYVSVMVYTNLINAFNEDNLTYYMPILNLLSIKNDFDPEKETDYKILYTVEISYLLKSFNSTSENNEMYLLKGFTDPKGNFRNEFYLYEQNLVDEIYYVNRPYFYDTGTNSLEEIYTVLTSNDSNVYGTGTIYNPYKVVIDNSYAEANNYEVEDIDSNEVSFTFNGISFQIIGTAYFPDVMYPVFDETNILPDVSQQAVLLTNPRVVYTISAGNAEYDIYLGFTDVYDNTNSYKDYTNASSYAYESIKERWEWFFLILFFYNPSFSSYSSDIRGVTILEEEGHSIENSYNLETSRILAAYNQVKVNEILTIILMIIFLLIIIIVLILLMEKRIRQNSKQLGVLKSIGISKWGLSTSYIIFPFLVILFGGILSFLIIIPLQTVFFTSALQYFSLPVVTISINVSVLLLVFIIPAIFLFSITFLIAIWYLYKSTDVLLSNKSNNKPGIILEKTNKYIPKNWSFDTSYRVKTILKSFGKSLLIFFAVFISIFLAAFSISSITMVDDLVDDVSSFTNFKYLINYNKEPIQFYNLSDPELNPNDDNYEVYYNQGMEELIIIEDFYGDYYNQVFDEELYQQFGYEIYLASSSTLVSVYEDYYEVNYYISAEQIGYLIYIYLGFWYSPLVDITDPWESFNYEYSLNAANKFFSYILNNWFFNLKYYDGDLENIKDYQNAALNTDYTFDLMFNDVYFYSHNENGELTTAMIGFVDLYNMPWVFKYLPLEQRVDHFKIWIVPTTEVYYEFFNFNDAVLEDFENTDTSQAIPIIVSEYDYQKLQNNFRVDENGYYEGMIRFNTGYYEGYWYNNHLNVKFDVVYVYEGYDFGSFTTYQAIDEYYAANENIFGVTEIDRFYNKAMWNDDVPIKMHTVTFYESATFEDLFFGNFNYTSTYTINLAYMQDLSESFAELIKIILVILGIFSLFIGFTLLIIILKEINDQSRKDISLFKLLGYSNLKSSSLVMTSYLFVIGLAAIIAIPLTILSLFAISTILTNLTGATFIFTVSALEWLFIISLVLILIITATIWSILAARDTSPLDIVKDNPE